MADLLDAIERRVAAALADVGSDIVADVKADLAERYPPASVPGEHPARRTGRLREGTTATVVIDNRGPALRLSNPTPYAAKLEATGRPVLSHVPAQWTPTVVARVTAAVRG